MSVSIKDSKICFGSGNSKQQAEQDAASNLLKIINVDSALQERLSFVGNHETSGGIHVKLIKDGIKIGGAHAVAAGSMFVFHGKHNAVLINYLSEKQLKYIYDV